MDQATRWAYMGKLQLMLQKQQAKIHEIGRYWDYIPIYEFKFKKYHFNLTDQNAQTQTLHTLYLNTPQDSSLTATSPFEDDMLQLSNDKPDFDSADNSDSDSITEINPRVDCDKINDDICTTYHCTKADGRAQCNGPVHNNRCLHRR